MLSSLLSFLSEASLMSYLPVAFLAAVPVLYLLFFAEFKSNLPPRMSVLLPALTGKFQLEAEGPLLAIKQGFERFGDVFRIRIGTQGFTFLIGGTASSVFFDAPDKEMSQKEVYKFTVPVFGKNIVYDAPPAVMIQQLKFVRQGLTGQSMSNYAPKIIRETEEFFSRWGDEGEVSLREALSELTILTAARCLLGDEIREQLYDEMADLYQDLNDGMTMISVFAPNLPTKAHRLRDAARVKIVKLFGGVIKKRRETQAKNPDAPVPNDFLQILIDARYRDGGVINDDEITGLILAGLFAGQHTSSITSTWLGLLILRDADRLVPRLLEEQDRVLAGTDGKMTFEAILEMDLMHACMKETLRMYPPLILLMRKVKADKDYKGYTIPKDDVVVVCPPVSHRLPEVYPNPDTFDPDRFFERKEGSGKHEYMAFGGGRHSCLGEKFAFLQIKAIWSHLLRNFEFTLLDKEAPKVDYTSIVAGPGNAVRVRFRRKK